MLELIKTRLAPFQHPSYRNFFLVQMLSLVGTWSHELARSWIILDLVGKAGALGSMSLAIAVPGLFLILQGGVIVDKYDVRKVMLITKSLLAISAFTLAFIVEGGHIQLWHLLLFGIIEGCVTAFDFPAYQAITVRLVPRQDFQQAMALNSTNFHTARMLGPFVAAILMQFHGPSIVFLFDGLSYVGVILVLKSLNLFYVQRKNIASASRWAALREGFKYMYETPELRYKLMQLFVTISLVYPLLIVVFRAYLQQKFNLNAHQYGNMFTFPAIGSMMGALSFAIIKPKRPINALKIGIPLAFFWLLVIPSAATPQMASIVIALIGFFMYLAFASLTVSLQLEVSEDFRGRLGAVIGMCFLSIGPMMGFPLGMLADYLGFERTIYLIATVFGLSSMMIALLRTRYVDSLKKMPAIEQ